MPAFPGWARALGPGIVLMALAQGSGELIWWPYLIAKYGLGLLYLLVPACLIQWPVIYSIGRYTLLTGESIWQGFIRLHRGFAFGLWMLMTVQFLWFGAFASAGGTAVAALFDFPAGWDARSRSLLWGYIVIGLFHLALIGSRRVYALIEKFMMVVAVVTVVGAIVSVANGKVLAQVPAFVSGMLWPQWPADRPWQSSDATRLLTGIAFAGLGGFWTLFYSYWIREKGAGMAGAPAAATADTSTTALQLPATDAQSAGEERRWRRFLVVDSGIGVFGNMFTTLLMALLAYVALYPTGQTPEGWQLAVVQAKFFELSLGEAGRILFLVVAAAFLADTWMSTTDAVARVHSDILHAYWPGAARRSPRFWYVTLVTALTALTAITMPMAEPGPLMMLSAVIGFAGTVLYVFALVLLNYRVVPTRPGASPLAAPLLVAVALIYTVLLVVYVWVWVG